MMTVKAGGRLRGDEAGHMLSDMAKDIRRTPLTADERRQAQRLKAAYEASKSRLGLTQEILGARLGMTQSSVGHYLNGSRSMNDLVLLRFCAAIEIDPETIRPGILDQLPSSAASSLDLSEKALEFARQFDSLSPDDQAFVLAVLSRVR
jgi:transcriptional regulator with XRE-family HTH domain